ncbi:glycosyltransferase family 4 protein [Cryomorpha ignava]|uniref:Glycosyltransferase family 4 protein n=1 Tax=Cryomorpha ignava TaxID=101383 RepID=A0A7K3WKS5_9FLAO|nr:glycosyltransferase family 4 protein [Cryomorpha ignava]NEN22239.1 glycosyltransferase family 4 protein [Cryomorpha ignava]
MKKVLFVCGSLEPGHDGVGDYTRELAGALKKRELEVKIISIRDRNVVNASEESQPAREEDVDVVRLSMSLSLKNRRKEYQRVIAEYNPNYISLQYVPYAFSSKGIPFGLPRFLNTEDSRIKWHFMIHEGYIDGTLNFKDNLIKRSQIAVLKSLEKKLKPEIIDTSTHQYQSCLSAIGLKSQILGLFGNIPILKTGEHKSDDGISRGVYFGASPNFENMNAFVEPIRRFLEETNEKLEITLCGQSGEKGKRFAALLRARVGSNSFTVQEKGRMSSEDLSKLFLHMDFGIARIPPQLLGKSGSAIALLEHGLPLWIPLAKSQDEIKKNFDFRLNQCFGDLADLKKSKYSFDSGSRLEEIVDSFIQKLTWSQEVVV